MKTEDLSPTVVEQSKSNEISQEQIQERQLLEDLLIKEADQLADNEILKRRREHEEIELLNGKKIIIAQIRDVVIGHCQPYEAMFPNSNPFFTEVFRLLGLTDRDPNKYIKPAFIGKLINQTIYARFHKDVQPALRTLAVSGGVRRYKFSQFLTPGGVAFLRQVRDEAVDMMKECTTWYEFHIKYGEKYNLPVQKRLFESYKND